MIDRSVVKFNQRSRRFVVLRATIFVFDTEMTKMKWRRPFLSYESDVSRNTLHVASWGFYGMDLEQDIGLTRAAVQMCRECEA